MLTQPKFSVVLITKNEEKTLPKLIKSLANFTARGGEIVLLDTGSTDFTADLARTSGCRVKEVGDKFRYIISAQEAKSINKTFCYDNDPPVVKQGDAYFDFASARNEAASLAKNDMICFADADEEFTALDIDVINNLIDEGFQQFEYNFVFAHDEHGREAIKFIQSKMYDRRVVKWIGMVHEVLTGEAKIKYLEENVYKLEHWQNHETHRHSYLTGLMVDCYQNPKKDRNSHYAARELMWSGRYKSAIQEFKRHIAMNGWLAERAESMTFIGDCYGRINQPKQQVEWYMNAFSLDITRRRPLIELARFYLHNKNYQGAVCMAKAAMEIPWHPFYANNRAHYEHEPEEILYIAYGWLGNVAKAQEHLLNALYFQPHNPNYLRDSKIYFAYGDNGIEGWMSIKELSFLYSTAKSKKTILEVGSWMGRSTNALLKGAKENGGYVTAVDTWEGSADVRDDTNWMAKQRNIFEIFKQNTKQYADCLHILRGKSIESTDWAEDKYFDMVFIDAGHTREEVEQDIYAWLPKVKEDGLICGHDYVASWMGVIDAVDGIFGKPDGVEGTIWWVDLGKRLKEGGLRNTAIQIMRLKHASVYTDAMSIPSTPFSIKTAPEFSDDIGEGHSRNISSIVANRTELQSHRIPNKIFSCWFSDYGVSIPDNIQKYLDSQQKLTDYDWALITISDLWQFMEINNCKYKKYINQCLLSTYGNKKWVKLTDYCRMIILYEFGGIFLDADVEIINPSGFDALLTQQMFVGNELEVNAQGLVVLGTAVIGATKGHPLIKKWIEEVEANFRGDDNLCYASSMDILNKIGVDYQDKMVILPKEYFYPYDHRTGETKTTDNTICIHHYNKTWVDETIEPGQKEKEVVEDSENLLPFKIVLESYDKNKSRKPGTFAFLIKDLGFPSIKNFTNWINNNINFTFVKRGDGELACMNDEHGQNCDGHHYTPRLAKCLRDSFEFLENNGAFIVDFKDQKIFNTFLHRVDNDMQAVSSFFKAISSSDRYKLFIRPVKLRDMDKILNSNWSVTVPEINAFNFIDRTISEIPIQENGIYLFCAGMPAKVMIAEMVKRNPNATYIDCGSSFDPISNPSRTFQISKIEFLYLYKTIETSDLTNLYTDIIKESEPETKSSKWVDINYDNFYLPQETHPERSFVLSHMTADEQIKGVIYDLGCSANKTIKRAIGVDIRPVSSICSDISDMPMLNDASADVIISRHSLEHLPDTKKALKEWSRILKPWGKLVIVLPDHEFINTFDKVLSNGEHLVAFTREQFCKLIKENFDEFNIIETKTVIENWSFGVIIEKLPKVSFIIPTLGREEGLQRCIKSIEALNYPLSLIRQTVIPGDELTVPKKVKNAVKNDYEWPDAFVYASNDVEFTPDSILHAVKFCKQYGLVAFNTGPVYPDEGNICEHFVITKRFLEQKGGDIFDCEFHHVGVDNLLWAEAKQSGNNYWCEGAVVHHYHFSRMPMASTFDNVYERGWKYQDEDRALLKVKLGKLAQNQIVEK